MKSSWPSGTGCSPKLIREVCSVELDVPVQLTSSLKLSAAVNLQKKHEPDIPVQLISPQTSAIPKRGAAILKNKVRINSCPIFMDSNMMAITVSSKSLISDFLFYKISFAKLSRIADTSTIPQINNKHIVPYRFALPPLSEQKKIADILSTWDKAIQTTQSLIEKLELRKKGLMQQLLSGKERLRGFKGKWAVYSIDSLFAQANRYVEWDEEESYPLVSIRRRYGGLFHRGNKLGKNIGVKKLKTISDGDFLISKRQVSHGAWVVVSEEFEGGKVSNEYECLQVKNEDILLPKFWSLFIMQPSLSHCAFLDSIGVHIEKLIFHYSLFRKRFISIPNSTEEQVAISDILIISERELGQVKKYLQVLQNQKKGLMQQLLTGKKRVKV